MKLNNVHTIKVGSVILTNGNGKEVIISIGSKVVIKTNDQYGNLTTVVDGLDYDLGSCTVRTRHGDVSVHDVLEVL